MFVIGTAGHVDHGKSTLVRALTGIDPDRLREEQERGMTIELGFAWLTLPSGREVSIVDVPGHIRFVRHMLAGIGAVDLALLIVAADEGVMPQTREHLAILDLLEVDRAIVVLTKCDLVDDAWAALVEEEVANVLSGTSLEGTPIVRVSATTGEGLDALRAALDDALAGAPEPSDLGRPRLGIDRVFTMTGFGTVVTGTLLGGQLHTGDTVEVVPGGRQVRIRGLQSHRREVGEALPGTRVAVNLAGVATEDLARGQAIAAPGRLEAARTLDVRLRALPGEAMKHNLRVTVHLGAAESTARLRLFGSDEVEDGGEAWAQIVLVDPVPAAAGDLLVVRVGDQTLGGARVIEVNPPRHRRTDPRLAARFEARALGTPESRLLAALERIEPCAEATLLRASGLEASEARATIEALTAEGGIHRLTPAAGEALLITASTLARVEAEARRALAGYHAAHPLRFSMPREEMRGALNLAQREFTAVLGGLAPGIEARGDGVAESDWEPQPSPQQRVAIEAAASALARGGLQPERVTIEPAVTAYLIDSGRAVDCGDGVILDASAFEHARQAITAILTGREAPITLAEARDLFGVSRRNAQAILERLDRQGVTIRVGDGRVLRAAR
ncbi:MAG: selenocysteine-specific translation elongation factor [Dehalococcoidia bacterium]|nr:MAG: selenocysteine-specific translation elongation factor [Dehalococcoidia bacterium]